MSLTAENIRAVSYRVAKCQLLNQNLGNSTTCVFEYVSILLMPWTTFEFLFDSKFFSVQFFISFFLCFLPRFSHRLNVDTVGMIYYWKWRERFNERIKNREMLSTVHLLIHLFTVIRYVIVVWISVSLVHSAENLFLIFQFGSWCVRELCIFDDWQSRHTYTPHTTPNETSNKESLSSTEHTFIRTFY